MGLLEETLRGKSLADYTNTQLRLALGAVLYTNTADMWKQYLNQIGYTGDVAQMLQKYYADYNVPSNFRNYINAGAFIFNPQNMFSVDAALQGYVYDLNDLSTLYLDSAGTTPASVNGAVGLVLDKSKGLALGSEIKSSGVIGLVGTATAATYNTSTGEGTATRVDASNQSFVYWTGLATSSWHLLTIQNTGANAIAIRTGAQSGAVWLTLLVGETKTIYMPESLGAITITSSGGAIAFTLSTIKQAQGNHAYQSATGNKPVLRGTSIGGNLVTNGDFASGTTGWSGINSPILSVVSGALRVTHTSANPGFTGGAAAVIGKVYRVTYTVVAINGVANIQPYMGGAGGTVRTAAGTYVDYITATGTSPLIVIAFDNTGYVDYDNIEVVDVSAGSVKAPYALQFDGSDDFLRTASVNFTATDKMTVCHGVRKLSDAAAGMLVELSVNTNTNNGVFYIVAPAAANTFEFLSKGTLAVVITRSPFVSPITAVLTMKSNIATPTCDTNVNTVASTTSTSSQGTGNFGNHALYFGRRGGTSLPYNGLMFSAICVGKAASAAELANIERWVNLRTGAY